MSARLDLVLEQFFSAARRLEPTPQEVQAVLERLAPARKTRPAARPRLALVMALLGGVLLAAAAALAVTLSDDEQLDRRIEQEGPLTSSGDRALDRLIERARTNRSIAPVADTFTIEAQAADPGGELPWAQVVWRTQTGGYCSFAGRQKGDDIGVISSSGDFAPFPFHEGGSCTNERLPSDASTFSIQSNAGGPTVIHGVAGAEVKELTVEGIPGVQTLTPSERGAFMAVLDADIRAPDFEVTLRLEDGSVRSLSDGPGTGS